MSGNQFVPPPMTIAQVEDWWLFTDAQGDVWQLTPTHDPACPLTIVLVLRRDVREPLHGPSNVGVQ